MSHQYQAIAWNRQKRVYDIVLVTGVTLYLTLFIGVSAFLFPYATTKTLIIRGWIRRFLASSHRPLHRAALQAGPEVFAIAL